MDMKTSISTLIIISILAIANVTAQAQNKVVLLDISHSQKSDYTNVNPQMFEQYHELVENKLGAALEINEDKELAGALLANTEVLIIISPLSSATSGNLTPTERTAIVNFVRNGGKVILFSDEDRRVNDAEFGGNDIIKPFGMSFGGDLPLPGNIGAISFVGEVIKGRYELPYSGGRKITGGIPLSVVNTEGGYVHGAYAELDNGGKIAAFGETMVGLFMGSVEMKRPNGETIVWFGEDDKQFMQELISWMLED